MDSILGIGTNVGRVPMIFCVLMCGGKGTRLKKTFGLDIEKPLIKLKNKTLIEYPINVLIRSSKFERIFAAVSSNTQKTREFIESNYGDKVTLIETMGREYSEDYLKTIEYFKEMENEKKLCIKKNTVFADRHPINLVGYANTIDRHRPGKTMPHNSLRKGVCKECGDIAVGI
jgi:GTP:adenosylcobinamide-phosphate guanylyltransferase